MRYFVTIVFILSSIFTIAQNNDDYDGIPELKRSDSLDWRRLSGMYRAEVGVFDRVRLQLNLSGSFTEIYIGRYDRDSIGGKWELSGQSLILKYTGEKTNAFDILEFCDYYILVPVLQKKEFIKEIKSVLAEAKKEKIMGGNLAFYVLNKLGILYLLKTDTPFK